MTNIIIFLVLQLLNVIISTFKSVLTIRGTKLTAALINAFSYSISIVIVYFVSKSVELHWSVIITAGTNLLGVYTGLSILEKLRKEQLWRIQTTITTEDLELFKEALLEKDIKFIAYETSWEKFKVVDIFSATREESKEIKGIIQKYNAKYTISTNSYTL